MKNENSVKGFSNLITVYSFILTVIVIWIHAGDAAISSEPYSSVQRFFSETLGQMAVPGFFLISGYLFFRNKGKASSFNIKEESGFFMKQWKKRSRSLLIPFLLWNTIYMIVYIISGRAGLNIDTVIEGIFFYRFNPVFWYIYQLIILMLLSPLVYNLIKDRSFCIISLIALYVLASLYDRVPYHIVNEDALFYFSIGAALSLHAKSFIENPAIHKNISFIKETNDANSEKIDTNRNNTEKLDIKAISQDEPLYNSQTLWLLILGIAVTSIGIFSYIIRTEYPLFGVIGLRVSMNAVLFSILKLLNVERFTVRSFMNISFFIYAYHYLEIRLIRMLWKSVSGPDIFLFILMPALCVVFSYLISILMKKIIPKVYQILCGGRDA